MPRTGIYRIALADGRCYVGQSADIVTRWSGHRYDLRQGRHHSRYLQRAWHKYGATALAFEVLEECEPHELAEREQHWIDTLKPVFNSRPAQGSTLGYKHTPETRAKISAALTGRKLSAEQCARRAAQLMGHRQSEGARAKMRAFQSKRSAEHRANLSASLKGRVTTPETRAKLSAAGQGRAVSAETRAKMSATMKATLAAKRARAQAAKCGP